MLTDVGDTVFDPFAGSCVTGEVAERLKRRWVCCELVEDYLKGALGRFERSETLFPEIGKSKDIHYKLYHPSAMWNGSDDEPLSPDGGRSRKIRKPANYPVVEKTQFAVLRERPEKQKRGRDSRTTKKQGRLSAKS